CQIATNARLGSGNRRGPRTPGTRAGATSRCQAVTLLTSHPGGVVSARARSSSAVYRPVPPGTGASSCSAITVSSREFDTMSILRRVPTAAVRTTVIVVTWRGVDVVGACLDALAQQRRAHRVLVVDNASEDGTDMVLATHPSAPRIVRLAHNTG